MYRLQSFQLRVAVGSPNTPVDGEDKRTCREKICAPHRVAVLVRELERRKRCADSDRTICQPAGLLLRGHGTA